MIEEAINLLKVPNWLILLFFSIQEDACRSVSNSVLWLLCQHGEVVGPMDQVDTLLSFLLLYLMSLLVVFTALFGVALNCVVVWDVIPKLLKIETLIS